MYPIKGDNSPFCRPNNQVLSVPNTMDRSSGDYGAEPIKIRSLEDHFIITSRLGRGYTATVFEGKCRLTGKVYAIKDIDKKKQGLIASQSYYKKVYAALSRLPPHRHLLSPAQLLETETHFYIVMERCYGCDTVAFALSHKPGSIPDNNCKELLQQLLLAVHCLHSHNILHRDIKLDNIMFKYAPYRGSEKGGNNNSSEVMLGDIALIDFDMCLLMDCPEPPKVLQNKNEVSVVGTREYMAPECFQGIYTPASDLWSIGVVLFVLIDGHFPFDVNVCSQGHGQGCSLKENEKRNKNNNNNSKSKNSKGFLSKTASSSNAASGSTNPTAGNQENHHSTIKENTEKEKEKEASSACTSQCVRRLLRQGIQIEKRTLRDHPLASDLVRHLLQYDIRQRIQSAFDALHHPWLSPIPFPVSRQKGFYDIRPKVYNCDMRLSTMKRFVQKQENSSSIDIQTRQLYMSGTADSLIYSNSNHHNNNHNHHHHTHNHHNHNHNHHFQLYNQLHHNLGSQFDDSNKQCQLVRKNSKQQEYMAPSKELVTSYGYPGCYSKPGISKQAQDFDMHRITSLDSAHTTRLPSSSVSSLPDTMEYCFANMNTESNKCPVYFQRQMECLNNAGYDFNHGSHVIRVPNTTKQRYVLPVVEKSCKYPENLKYPTSTGTGTSNIMNSNIHNNISNNIHNNINMSNRLAAYPGGLRGINVCEEFAKAKHLESAVNAFQADASAFRGVNDSNVEYLTPTKTIKISSRLNNQYQPNAASYLMNKTFDSIQLKRSVCRPMFKHERQVLLRSGHVSTLLKSGAAPIVREETSDIRL